jgi:Mechanosensitive ion channel
MRDRRSWIVMLALSLSLAATTALARDSNPAAPSADDVLDGLKRVLAWAQQARVTVQAVREASVGVLVHEDEQIVARVLQRAFESARARAALVVQAPTGSDEERARTTRRAQRRAELEAAIRKDERELARAQARARAVPRSQREATTVANRLALDRMRLDLLKSLEQADVSLTSGEPDLLQQIQALQEAAPEVAGATPSAKAATSGTTTPVPASFGTWASVHRLLALQRAHTAIAQLALTTEERARTTDVDVQTTRQAVRELLRTLRALAGDAPGSAPAGVAGGAAPTTTSGGAASPTGKDAAAPARAGGATPPGASPTPSVDEQHFRAELERLKTLTATMVPLRAEVALLRRFESDLRIWRRGIDRDIRTELQNLAVGLIGVVLALGAIFVGAIVWRIAANRYITDPYRRRLALNVRGIVLALAVVLVLVFHFTSELTALVTALGFAAAGIAFALQNVILAVAGYFSMVAPNGIRVGDRVSLQGPFTYVHGEVIEIGLVRIRLRELAADTLEPTGRIVVFPNSVVFTGSFFKHPPAQAKAA